MKIFATIALWILLPLLITATDEGEDYDWVNEMFYEFPDVGNDLTKVTWEHAVNSQARLKQALKGDAMIIEADVSIGKYTDDPHGNMMPIMAHPPDTVSDLTLQQFLNETLKAEKHIKLDFKTREAFSATEAIVTEAMMSSYNKRIWLNADIVPGPINCSKTVVDADYFLSTCVAKFPGAVISVGWSTCYSQNNFKGGYTAEQLEAMTDALNKNMVMGSVSFAIRAGPAAQSVESIVNLMRTSLHETTLTIWSSPGDPVDVQQLLKLIDTVGRDKIFIDVPQDLHKQIANAQLYRIRHSSSSPVIASSISLLTAVLLLTKLF